MRRLLGLLAFLVAVPLIAKDNATHKVTTPSFDAVLIKAIVDGDLAGTRRLLDQYSANRIPWPVDKKGKPLLFLAIEGRAETHPAIVELLFERGANVEEKGPDGKRALHWAAQFGYAERTEQILKRHPAIEANDDSGRTPLLVAHSAATARLLAAKANWLAMDRWGNTAFHYAAEDGAAHLQLLYDAGFKIIDARNNAGLSPLHFAAVAGNESACRWLLDHGANVNAITAADYDYLPLEFAPGLSNEVRLRAGSTPLGIATMRHQSIKWSSSRFKPVIELLIARGATSAWRPNLLALGFFAILLCITAISFFAGLFLIDARMTGWHAMAQRFSAAGEPPSPINRFQDGGVGTIGLVQLRKLLRAAVTNDGLYLAFPKILSFGHPPLLLPWGELHLASDKTFLGIRAITLHVSVPKIGRVVLRGGVATDVIERLAS